MFPQNQWKAQADAKEKAEAETSLDSKRVICLAQSLRPPQDSCQRRKHHLSRCDEENYIRNRSDPS